MSMVNSVDEALSTEARLLMTAPAMAAKMTALSPGGTSSRMSAG